MEKRQKKKQSKLELARILYDEVAHEHECNRKKVEELESQKEKARTSSVIIIPLTEEALQQCCDDTKPPLSSSSSHNIIHHRRSSRASTAGRDSNYTQVIETVAFNDLLSELNQCIRCSNKASLCTRCQEAADAMYSKCESRLMFGSRGANSDELPSYDDEKMEEFHAALESKHLISLRRWNTCRRERERAFQQRIKEFDSSISIPCHEIGQRTEFCATGM